MSGQSHQSLRINMYCGELKVLLTISGGRTQDLQILPIGHRALILLFVQSLALCVSSSIKLDSTGVGLASIIQFYFCRMSFRVKVMTQQPIL